MSFLRSLHGQVIAAIVLGIALGHFNPTTAVQMKVLGDVFINLIKMLIAPIIFCTVVGGVAGMGDMKEAGRIGVRALVYFIILSGISLLLGLVVANAVKPGAGVTFDLSTKSALPDAAHGAEITSLSDFLIHIVPSTFVDAFATGNVLQVLLVALLFAAAIIVAGEKARSVTKFIDEVAHLFFIIIGFIMRLAPFGAFGAMAYTVGHYGIAALLPLAKLLLCFYITCILFILVVLGGVLRWAGLNILQFIGYLRDELLIVFGTSSSETVLPRMLDKMTALGCARPVVGMVLPTGYSFNLDGTAIYLTMAAIFLAQVTGTPLSLGDQLTLLAVMMLSSKGAAGVTGAGFAVLAGSLGAVGHIPIASLALILGVDRFMSQGRALTNLIGNGVATVVLAQWEGKLDIKNARAVLAGKRTVKLETD